MHFINLDDPAGNAEFMFFPGGEPFAKVADIKDERVFIKACVRSWDDFGWLVSLLDAIYHQDKEIFLFLPYFPGARQDRNPNGFTPLSVDMYASILGKYVRNIIIFDMHSEVGRNIVQKYIYNCHFLSGHDIPPSWLPGQYMVDYIIAPDKGAVKRANLMKQHRYPKATVIECEKDRDWQTGNIVQYRLPTFFPTLPAGNFFVIDDIIDGGRTFNMLANEWEKAVKPGSHLWLYASHGIFSKGIESLSVLYEKIYTTDSWYCGIEANRPDRLKVIPLTFIINEYLKGYK